MLFELPEPNAHGGRGLFAIRFTIVRQEYFVVKVIETLIIALIYFVYIGNTMQCKIPQSLSRLLIFMASLLHFIHRRILVHKFSSLPTGHCHHLLCGCNSNNIFQCSNSSLINIGVFLTTSSKYTNT